MRDPHRRSLTHVGGPVQTDGDEELARGLAEALDVSSSRDDEDAARAHVHGFHAYPARMHPWTASRLVQLVAERNAVVLDPFCGSGTVVAEAMIAGREAAGSDLNPIALELTTVKTRPRSDEELEDLVARAREIAANGDTRRKERAGATRRYPEDDVALFDPHVLLELDSIRSGIQQLPEADPAKTDLRIVLSALLVKVSKKSSDSGDAFTPNATKRLAAGYTLKLFVKKTEELAARLQEFTRLVPVDALLPRLATDDATKLRTVPGGRVDAIVTSPPYAATYDYLAHHALRSRWLDLRTEVFAERELGARRHYRALTSGEASDAWDAELDAFFRAAHRVLTPSGLMVLILADSAVQGKPLRVDDAVARVAARTGFIPLAKASQDRPHFHPPTEAAFRDRPRQEHALLLERG